LSIFSQTKSERDMKNVKELGLEPRVNGGAASAKAAPEMVSTLGHGVLITGNIVCAGSLQICGRVVGDIHASQLIISEGAKVEGKVTALDLTIQGTFSGTINGNHVKLQSTAVVDGEIFNKSLAIEQNAMFEGVARRLDLPVAAPSIAQVKGDEPAPVLAPVLAPHAVPEFKVVS